VHVVHPSTFRHFPKRGGGERSLNSWTAAFPGRLERSEAVDRFEGFEQRKLEYGTIRFTLGLVQLTSAAFQARASLNQQATDPKSHTTVRTFLLDSLRSRYLPNTRW
jgi:hypothetical protein